MRWPHNEEVLQTQNYLFLDKALNGCALLLATKCSNALLFFRTRDSHCITVTPEKHTLFDCRTNKLHTNRCGYVLLARTRRDFGQNPFPGHPVSVFPSFSSSAKTPSVLITRSDSMYCFVCSTWHLKSIHFSIAEQTNCTQIDLLARTRRDFGQNRFPGHPVSVFPSFSSSAKTPSVLIRRSDSMYCFVCSMFVLLDYIYWVLPNSCNSEHKLFAKNDPTLVQAARILAQLIQKTKAHETFLYQKLMMRVWAFQVQGLKEGGWTQKITFFVNCHGKEPAVPN